MNEFIVWDKDSKSFTENFTISPDGSVWVGRAGVDTGYKLQYEKKDTAKLLNYIGKTDINNKKIYADCSIVEFDIKDHIDKNKNRKYVGFFSFDSRGLRYRINYILSDGTYESMTYNRGRVRNIEIIDTIQENKLGIVKT